MELCTTYTDTHTLCACACEMKWKRDNVEAPWHPTMSDLCVSFSLLATIFFSIAFSCFESRPRLCILWMHKLLDICVIYLLCQCRFNVHVVTHSAFRIYKCIYEFYVLRILRSASPRWCMMLDDALTKYYIAFCEVFKSTFRRVFISVDFVYKQRRHGWKYDSFWIVNLDPSILALPINWKDL